MLYVIAFEETPKYLHARVTGERSAKNLLRYLEESLAAALASGRSNVLLEMHFTGPSLSSSTLVNVISLVVWDAMRLRKIALVEAAGGDPAMAFAETVALNRGVNAKLFHSVGEAAQWLSDAAPDGGQDQRKSGA
jgi:hypothetical protein